MGPTSLISTIIPIRVDVRLYDYDLLIWTFLGFDSSTSPSHLEFAIGVHFTFSTSQISYSNRLFVLGFIKRLTMINRFSLFSNATNC